jgi:PAS domain S-box-containing protein
VTALSVVPSDRWAHFHRAHGHAASACSSTAGLIDILDAVDVPIVVVGREFTVTCFNLAAAELLGFTPADVGHSPSDVPVLAGLRHLETWCAQATTTASATRYDFRDRDKSYLLRIAPCVETDGRVTGSVLTFANVTAFRASIDQAIYEREYTKTILNTVADPLAVLDPELHVLTANRAFFTMFGLSRDSTQSIPLGEIGNNAFDFAPLHMRLQRTLAEDSEFQPFEIDHEFPEMGRRIFVLSARRFSLPGRSGGMLLLGLQDITQHRRAEEELQRRHEELEDFFENGAVALHLVGADGTIVRVNQAELDLLGYRREEYVGRNVAEFHADEDAIEVILARLCCGETLDKYPARLRAKDGTIRQVQITSNAQFEDGKLINTRCFTIDVTEQKQAENELRDRERRFRELIEALPAAVYTTDAAGRITFYNQAAIEFAGRRPVLGNDQWCVSWRLFRPDGTPLPHDECPMAIALKEDRPIRGTEAIAERPDGTRLAFIPYPTPLHDASGALIGAVNMLVDITERKKAEEALQRLTETLEERVVQRTQQLQQEVAEREKAEAALRQSLKMEAVGQLTGGVAHDFNNLLTVVTGNLDLLERWAGADGAARRHVDAAQRAAWQGARLAQQLLAFARRQDLRPEVVHLGHAMAEYESLLRRALGEAIEVTITCEPNLSLCRIDPAQFENSILNLAFNARDAMPDGGLLAISLHNDELAGGDMPPHAAPGDHVVVSVSDTGVGIAPERLDRVFEPFYTTKEVGRGTGLGLSQVYGFVEQSGGHIRIESAVSAGTTVRIYLPKTGGASVGLEKPELGVAQPAKGSETVLLVEDDPAVLDVVTAMMEELGYRVLTAQNGPEALSLLNRGVPIDLLFTDVVMPHGMSGGELAQRARQMRPKLKILLGSGYSAGISPEAAAAAQDLPRLGKPYRQAELAAKLRTVLAEEIKQAAAE